MPSKLSEGTRLDWFGPSSYLQRNNSAWGWGESECHHPPWQNLGTHTGRVALTLCPTLSWSSVRAVCAAGKWGLDRDGAKHLKGMQEFGWRVGEERLAQEPTAQADVELTEMGRSQQRVGGGEEPVRPTSQEPVVGRIRTWVQMGYSGETNMVQW